MIDDILLEAEDKMDKTVEAARHEFGNIRTGRANAGMFEQLLVDYYGAPTPMQQLASFQIPEARTVLISPFDRTATQEIIKTLRESDLGVNPTDDGNVVRVVLPALTEERRKEYVKQAKNKAEDARVSVRSIRRKAKEALDRLKKDGDAGEDEVERAEKALESATKARVELIDKLLATKESELLTISCRLHPINRVPLCFRVSSLRSHAKTLSHLHLPGEREGTFRQRFPLLSY